MFGRGKVPQIVAISGLPRVETRLSGSPNDVSWASFPSGRIWFTEPPMNHHPSPSQSRHPSQPPSFIAISTRPFRTTIHYTHSITKGPKNRSTTTTQKSSSRSVSAPSRQTPTRGFILLIQSCLQKGIPSPTKIIYPVATCIVLACMGGFTTVKRRELLGF